MCRRASVVASPWGPALHVLTLTADDGHVQATDTVVYDFRFTDPGPEGWTRADIGGVAAAGSSVFSWLDDEFTVTGSGADIWGRADEFHFTSTEVYGGLPDSRGSVECRGRAPLDEGGLDDS